jgi:hypothetical protein
MDHTRSFCLHQATSHVVERDEIVTVTLILACIVVWQAQEILRVFSFLASATQPTGSAKGLDTADL